MQLNDKLSRKILDHQKEAIARKKKLDEQSRSSLEKEYFELANFQRHYSNTR